METPFMKIRAQVRRLSTDDRWLFAKAIVLEEALRLEGSDGKYAWNRVSHALDEAIELRIDYCAHRGCMAIANPEGYCVEHFDPATPEATPTTGETT
jgi:hypothetical protein